MKKLKNMKNMKRTTQLTLLAGVLVLALSVSVYAVSMGQGRANAPGQLAASSPTIVETAIAVNQESGEFSILIAALQAADPSIIQTLSNRGQYTVFAPTDEAFLALFDELSVEPADVLANQALLDTVLTYHVTAGKRNADSVTSSTQIKTLQGSFLWVDGAMLIDELGRESNIVAVDIMTSNGIIHIIDAVVVPDEALALLSSN